MHDLIATERVPVVRVERTRPCGHQILSLTRLPIPPYRQGSEQANAPWDLSKALNFGLSTPSKSRPKSIENYLSKIRANNQAPGGRRLPKSSPSSLLGKLNQEIKNVKISEQLRDESY